MELPLESLIDRFIRRRLSSGFTVSTPVKLIDSDSLVRSVSNGMFDCRIIWLSLEISGDRSGPPSSDNAPIRWKPSFGSGLVIQSPLTRMCANRSSRGVPSRANGDQLRVGDGVSTFHGEMLVAAPRFSRIRMAARPPRELKRLSTSPKPPARQLVPVLGMVMCSPFRSDGILRRYS